MRLYENDQKKFKKTILTAAEFTRLRELVAMKEAIKAYFVNNSLNFSQLQMLYAQSDTLPACGIAIDAVDTIIEGFNFNNSLAIFESLLENVEIEKSKLIYNDEFSNDVFHELKAKPIKDEHVAAIENLRSILNAKNPVGKISSSQHPHNEMDPFIGGTASEQSTVDQMKKQWQWAGTELAILFENWDTIDSLKILILGAQAYCIQMFLQKAIHSITNSYLSSSPVLIVSPAVKEILNGLVFHLTSYFQKNELLKQSQEDNEISRINGELLEHNNQALKLSSTLSYIYSKSQTNYSLFKDEKRIFFRIALLTLKMSLTSIRLYLLESQANDDKKDEELSSCSLM